MAEIDVFGVVAADVILRVPRVPASGDQVNAEALGWRIGGSSANVACGLSTAGHHVRLVGPVGTDSMGDHLLAELERYGVDTEYCFRADAASPRTLILLDDTGERTIIAVDSGARPFSFLPERGPDLQSADCVYIEGYTRYPPSTAADAEPALLVTSPPASGAATWPATLVVGSETQYGDVTSAEIFEAVRSVAGERLEWVVVTRGTRGADAYASTGQVHVDAVAADQIDATGAGDAFTVGLLDGLLQSEEDFRLGKDSLGLDQCQARLYTAIQRHIVLVMAALAICAVTAAWLRDRTDAQAPPPVTPGQTPPPDPGMIPLTVPEIKRLLAAVLTRRHPRGHAACWLAWRRRHQARSRWFHQRTRLSREYTLVN